MRKRNENKKEDNHTHVRNKSFLSHYHVLFMLFQFSSDIQDVTYKLAATCKQCKALIHEGQAWSVFMGHHTLCLCRFN